MAVPLKEHFSVLLDGQVVRTADVTVHVDGNPMRDGDRIKKFAAGDIPSERLDDVKLQITISIGLDHQLCRDRDCMSVLNRIDRDLVQDAERIEPLFRQPV